MTTDTNLTPVSRGIPIEGVRLEFRGGLICDEPCLSAYISVVTEEGRPPHRVFLASIGLAMPFDQATVIAEFRKLCTSAMNRWIASIAGVPVEHVTNLEVAPGAAPL